MKLLIIQRGAYTQIQGKNRGASVAEWSIALVSGTSDFYDVGLNPTTSSPWNFWFKTKCKSKFKGFIISNRILRNATVPYTQL